MADVYLGRLTGKIRDSVPPGGAGGIDPPCEVEVEVLSGEFTATRIPAHVTSSTGSPMPWYAAAIYFFGTLDVVVATDGEGRRTYDIDVTHAREPGALVIRLYRSTTDITCVEIPTSAVFNAVVLGLGGGGPGAVVPDQSFAVANKAGPGVVFPGRYARLAFIAPDGSMYGDKGEETGGARIPLGYYPDTFTPDGTGFPDGDPVIVDGWNDYHAPPLQVWSPVVAMIHHVDTGSTDHIAVWAIKPSGSPDAKILRLRPGTVNNVENPAHIVQPAIMTRRTDVAPAIWELASCDASTFSNVNIRDPLQEVGVALWSDHEADGNVAVVVSGRFWINPASHPLRDHTTYYLDPAANYEKSPTDDHSPGMWTSEPPGNAVMTRPIFRHYTKGWCMIVEPVVDHAMAWRYGVDSGASPEVFNIAEIAFDWFYYNDPTTATALLRFRDRPSVMPDPADLPDGEKGTAPEAPLGQAPESWDVMSWFTSELYERRAFVMKRLDLVIAGNPDQTTIPDIDFSLPTRPGKLAFYMDYGEDARIGDAYDFFAIQDSCLSWIPVSGGNNFGPGGPGVVIGGVLTVQDGYQTVMKWYTCPEFGAHSPAGVGDYDKRYRKVVWDIATEYQAHDWAWRYTTDDGDTFDDALILNHDQDLIPILNGNPNAEAALPLKFREIEICDSSDDSVKKIIVLCSEMYT